MLLPPEQLLCDVRELAPPELIQEIEKEQSHNPHSNLVLIMLLAISKMMLKHDKEEDEGGGRKLISDDLMADNHIIQAAGLAYPWRLHKTVVTLDPELANALSGSDFLRMPLAILDTLPLRHFYLKWDDEIWVGGQRYKSPGGFVRYIPDSPVGEPLFSLYLAFNDPDDPDMTNWQAIHLTADVDNFIDFDETLKSTERAMHLFRLEIDVADPIQILNENKGLVGRYLRIVSYMASKGADYTAPTLAINPVKTRRHGLRVFDAKKLAEIRIGANIGQQIRVHRENKAAMVRTGKNMPHLRRAHFALLRVGVGRQKQELIWRRESFINASEVEIPVERTVA